MHKAILAVAGRLLFLLLVLAVAAGALLAAFLVLGAGQKMTRELAALRSETDTRPVAGRAADTMPVATRRAPVAVHLLSYGAHPAWTQRGDRIVYQRNLDGVSELFMGGVATDDSRCLTVGGQVPPELRGKHKGNALVHPSGRAIVFTAENRNGDHGPGTLPENGFNHDLWVMTIDGKKYWRLAATPEKQAVAGLVLSPDGTRLLWSQQVGPPRADPPGGELGSWELRLANLQLWPQGAQLSEMRALTPLGRGYYGTGSFLRDNRAFIFSGADSGVSAYGADLYCYDPRQRRPDRLTATPLVFDVNARLAPSGGVLAWTAGRRTADGRDWQAELFLMRLRGATVAQLTRFNEAGYDEYLREPAMLDAPAWHPGGAKLVAGYRYRRGMLGWQQRLFLLPLTNLPGDIMPPTRSRGH